MNKKQIGLIIIGVFMICIVVYTTLLKDNFIPKNNISSQKNTEEKSKSDTELEGTEIKFETESVNENSNDFKSGDKLEFEDAVYTINSVERTKERKNFQIMKEEKMAKVDDHGKIIEEKPVEFDENGNIQNEFSYLIINVTVKNKKNEDVTKNFYNTVDFYNKDDEALTGAEISLMNKEQKLGDKSYLNCDIKANEELTTDFIYIMWDEYLDYNNMELIIRNTPKLDDPISRQSIKIKY